MITGIKNCVVCGKQLKGRSDKKFCDDYCRNNFNNRLNSLTNQFIRGINGILKKNRRILESLIAKEKTVKISRENLLQQGFQFNYHTHTHTNKKGLTYYFCYEFGYLPLENDWYAIVKKKE